MRLCLNTYRGLAKASTRRLSPPADVVTVARARGEGGIQPWYPRVGVAGGGSVPLLEKLESELEAVGLCSLPDLEHLHARRGQSQAVVVLAQVAIVDANARGTLALVRRRGRVGSSSSPCCMLGTLVLIFW